MLWVEGGLARYSESACGWDIQFPTLVVLSHGVGVPIVQRPWSPRGSRFWGVEYGCSLSGRRAWDAIEIMYSFEAMIRGQFWVHSGGACVTCLMSLALGK